MESGSGVPLRGVEELLRGVDEELDVELLGVIFREFDGRRTFLGVRGLTSRGEIEPLLGLGVAECCGDNDPLRGLDATDEDGDFVRFFSFS